MRQTGVSFMQGYCEGVDSTEFVDEFGMAGNALASDAIRVVNMDRVFLTHTAYKVNQANSHQGTW
ncbi:hypothetical protein CRD60_00760 [Bifidobacterium aemilianum]|uniref:Uncharacterized protein n=1 Tax=Bifidobacterium aemilianum TaxID=2493120 RepID=A0A366KB11_9BIFI|nr:hypothetical protein CRD60_00760 [Bifidobacterium aemilianum]